MNGLIEGKKYVLSTPVDTVITDVKYNIPLGTVKAGQQYVFQAVSDAVTVADGCTIRPFEGSNGASVGVVGGGGEGGSGGGEGDYLNYTFAEDGTYSIKGEMPNLTNGTSMFRDIPVLKSFIVNMPNLTNGQNMFGYCGLTSWNADLSNLTNGNQMFSSSKSLTSFNSDLSSLTNGYAMFLNCKGLTSFRGDLSSLVDGRAMFQGCNLDLDSIKFIFSELEKNNGLESDDTIYIGYNWDNLCDDEFIAEFSITIDTNLRLALTKTITNANDKIWSVSLWPNEPEGELNLNFPNLKYGYNLLYNNTYITSVIGDLSSLINGYGMFYNCTYLKSFNCDLSSLTNGSNMFRGCSKLASFSSNLQKLENGERMFQQTILTSWNIDLPNLTNGNFMFGYNKFTSWNIDLPNLTNGNYMFTNCTSLKSFTSDLSSLSDGTSMFSSCNSLTSFNGDLSSLTIGSSMFGYSSSVSSKLDLASVQNIAETINDLTSKGTTGTISIGIAKALQSDDETAPVNVALAAIRAKGWTVTEIYRS